jgi:uncharacterized protein YndB with AHSA1/START domain
MNGRESVKIVREIEIAQPPEAVFPWIADPPKAMLWQKDVRGGEILASTPDVVGTAFTETVEDDGGRLEMTGTITEYRPNRAMGFHLNSRIHEFDVRYSLEGRGKTTRVSMGASIRWKFPMNVISLAVRKKMEKSLGEKMDTELRELKRVCEAA